MRSGGDLRTCKVVLLSFRPQRGGEVRCDPERVRRTIFSPLVDRRDGGGVIGTGRTKLESEGKRWDRTLTEVVSRRTGV